MLSVFVFLASFWRACVLTPACLLCRVVCGLWFVCGLCVPCVCMCLVRVLVVVRGVGVWCEGRLLVVSVVSCCCAWASRRR